MAQLFDRPNTPGATKVTMMEATCRKNRSLSRTYSLSTAARFKSSGMLDSPVWEIRPAKPETLSADVVMLASNARSACPFRRLEPPLRIRRARGINASSHAWGVAFGGWVGYLWGP